MVAGMEGQAGIKRLKMDSMARDPVKDRLVAQIKAFQRQGDEARELWRVFCDTNLASILDPNRHEPHVLDQFVKINNVPELDAFPSLPPMEPVKETLVFKIKAYQRRGNDEKDHWYN